MSTIDSRRSIVLPRLPAIRDYGAPGWYERLPPALGTAGVLALLVAISGFMRVHYIDNQIWFDEANAVGIATHPLTSIPGILWRGGGAPLYFMLLHVWMDLFGDGTIAVHALSVLTGLVTVPLGMWLGWSLYGRRVGLMLALLLAFNPFLTTYAEEGRPYELLGLFGLLVMGAFLHVFVHRRGRGWAVTLAIGLAALVYTDAWGFFVWAAAALAVVPVAVRSDDRGGVIRDALLVFGGAFVLYLPWLPTLIHQTFTATSPWDYVALPGANLPRDVFGSDRVMTVLALAAVAGLVPLLFGSERRSALATAVWAAAVIGIGGFLIARVVAIFGAPLAARYVAPLIAPMLVLAAIACARSGIAGLVLLIVACSLLANPGSFITIYKSDMRDVAAEIAPYVRAGDLVVVAQPEQAPLAWYSLPAGLRYATMLGPDPHPTYMDWDHAETRLEHSDPRALVDRLVASLAPGQRLVLIRPVTEGEKTWAEKWAALVRLRAAQWGALIGDDAELSPIPGSFAPHNYRGSCCIASSALVYVKR